MIITVSGGTLGGTVPAIPSKSFAHRLLIGAAMSQRPCSIRCEQTSDDIMATVRCLNALGADIRREDGGFFVVPMDTSAPAAGAVLDCGESGSTLRFMLPVACALGGEYELKMGGRLPGRPLSPLYEELSRHGIVLSAQGVSPLRVRGRLKGRDFTMPGDVSSQFISGLLLAMPVMGGGTVELTGRVESGSYIDITAECLRLCGADVSREGMKYAVSGRFNAPDSISVEGDWSNAAFWLCAGAVGKNSVAVTGLNPESVQGDRKIVDIIKKFGGNIMVTEDQVISSPSSLHGTDIDASDIPDLVPVISVLAAAAEGETRIYNAGRLRLKESDRLAAVSNIMSTLSVDITEKEDGLIINGTNQLRGGRVDAWNDHRIAMTAAVAALIADSPVVIEGAECVKKSYPGFFEDFRRLGGEAAEGE